MEGAAKVTGATRFTADLRLSDLAHARLLLSTQAHARIVRLELEEARRAPGVLLVMGGSDLPPMKMSGAELPLARGEVVYAGQPVAAVVAETEAAAADAVALIEVEYESLPAAVDPADAIKPAAPLVLGESTSALDDAGAHGIGGGEVAVSEKPRNVTAVVEFRQGDAHAALAACDAVVEGRYSMPGVHQGFLETHVAMARPEPDGGVTIWAPTQGTFLTRKSVSEALGLPLGSVKVIPMAVGGGFGGKVYLLESLVVLLALRAGRAVRLELTRNEEFLMGRAAPGSVIDLKLGADRDGTLKALWAHVVFDNGAGMGGLGGLAGIFLASPYRLPAYEITGHDVATHKTPVAAYRAPGAPQAFFALESAMDELARKLGLDPLEFRLRNASREGDARPDGTRWPRIGLVECLEAAREHPLLRVPLGAGEGVGIAVGGWGGGREPAAAGCRVEPDGTLVLHVGYADISGTDTTMAMIAAETFGVALDRVKIQTGDTDSAPYSGMAGGSKITYTVGPAVQQAAAEARRQLLDIAAEELEAAAEDLVIEDGEVRVTGVPGGRSMGVGQLAGLAAQFGGRYPPVLGHGRTAITEQSPMFTVQIAKVAVDAEAGAFQLTAFAAIQDVGKAINPPEVVGQIHGGALQALGRALGEELVYDSEGQLRTASFLDYQMPSIDQVPDIDVLLLEIPSPVGPFGARGVGEPPAVPGPAAVANAIRAAVGVRLDSVPVRAGALLASLQPEPARPG